MDADLYEQLNTTITQPSEHRQSSETAIQNQTESTTSDQDVVESDSATPNTRHKRTTSTSLPQEIDQVVQAITASPWAARLGNIVGTVKKQGESVFETTKERANKELGNVRSGIASLTSPAEETSQQDAMRTVDDSAAPTSPTRITPGFMFSYLKSTADAAQKKFTPTLKEISKAEDAADAYLNKLGASFGQLLKDVVTIAPPEESTSLNQKEGDVLFDTKVEKRTKIYTSRTDVILHELHSHPDILRRDPDPVQEPAFQSWSKDFSAETHTDEIASLLERYPELRSQMDTLVPEHVSYSDFWKRYLYQKSKIDADEARRKQMIETKDEDHEFDWDGDDDADDLDGEGKASTETVKQVTVKTRVEENPRNSSTSESSTSFDIVSQSSAVPPLTKEKEDKGAPLAEESDDDWE